jgi:hypothetical protein
MHERELQPLARTEGLVVQELGDESLVYDRESDVAHCLGGVAARVWRGCNGERDFEALANFSGTSESLAAEAVGELRAKGLLVASPVSADNSTDVSRRHALKRIVGTGLAATSVPLIVSASVASAAPPSGVACSPCGTASSGPCGLGYTCIGGFCIPIGCTPIPVTSTCSDATCPMPPNHCMQFSCSGSQWCCP